MKQLKKILACGLALVMLVSMCSTAMAAKTNPVQKVDKSELPRVIVTTDGEVDDQNSLRHMALYFNDMDIAGLVYSSAEHHFEGDGVHTLKEITPNYKCDGGTGGDYTSFRPAGTTWIHDMITNEYAKDYEHLVQNDPNYPSPEELLAVTKVGNVLFEGDTREETEGSNLIRDAILDDDDRLLYIQAWGGNNTIVRALLSIYETYHGTDQWDEIYDKVCSKVVFQKGMDQDNSWADNNMTEKFPDLMFMTVDVSLGYFLSQDAVESARPYFNADFLKENIKFNHGEMMSHYNLWLDGTHYPGKEDEFQFGTLVDFIDWGFPGHPRYFGPYEWIGEGDSPMWMAMISVGLRGLESMDSYNYGSWAGRMTWKTASGEVLYQPDLTTEYNYITGEMTSSGGFFSSGFSGQRFLDEFMLDWAARADWTTAGYEDCNHPAVVSVENLDVTAYPGDVVALNGSVSYPDVDNVSVKWWVYEGAGVYSGSCTDLQVWNDDQLSTSFTVPKDAKAGDYFNVILEVTDKAGEYSSFTRYAQVIIKVAGGTFQDVDSSSPCFDAVEAVTAAGIMNGKGSGTFSPADSVTVKEMVAVLARLAGQQPQQSVTGSSAWYMGYADWARSIGLVAENASWDAAVSAEEMDTMIKTAAEKLGKTYTPTGAAATRGDLAVRLAGLL